MGSFTSIEDPATVPADEDRPSFWRLVRRFFTGWYEGMDFNPDDDEDPGRNL